MRILIFLCLLGVAICNEPSFREVLKSNKKIQSLYRNYKSKEHLKYSGSEDKMRFKLFKKNVELIARYNEKSDDAAFGLNFFSTMTPAEKKQRTGLNVTGIPKNPRAPPRAGKPPPKKVLWTNVGAVTKIKDQKKCTSCWTFGSVGAIESRYKMMTGVLRSFAEQEFLDCAYGPRENGCKQSGWYGDAFKYSRIQKRLAAGSDYKYEGVDKECRAEKHRNALVGAEITGHRGVFEGEAPFIKAVAEGSLAAAIEVTDYFHQYKHGIFKDTTCKKGSPNHAVTVVGYTGKFILVKNSWGEKWGDKGFIKFARRHDNCGLFEYASYPILKKTGKKDSKPDKGTGYRPIQNDKPAPPPDDKKKDCPSGTIRCPDGKCRHQHMC